MGEIMSKAKGNGNKESNVCGQLNAIRQSEEHFRHLFEDSPLAMWEEDFSLIKKRIDKIRAGGVTSFKEYFSKNPGVVVGCMNMVTISTVNRAGLDLFKADRKEFLRYGLASVYGEKNCEAFSRELLAVAEGKTVFEGELLTQALTGEARHIVVRWAVPTTYEDTYSRVLVGVLDVTQRYLDEEVRKHLEDHVRQSERLSSLSELSGKLAHDFNNVLMAIFGYSEILLGVLGERTKEHMMVAQIEEAARRAADLTQQLGIYSGKSRPVVATLDATQVLEDMKSALKNRSMVKAILKFDLKEKLLHIEADASQIRQIVPILVDNAVEAIGDKAGIVTIRTGEMECDAGYLRSIHGGENLPAGNYAYIEVVDTGKGMNKETLSQLFVPFFTTKSHKSALDLSVLLGIVRSHKGAVAVTSEVGAGTSFKILFPVSAKAISEAKEKVIDMEKWKGSGSVLIIDDEPMIREVLQYMLEDMGFEVLTGSDGQAGVDEYRKNSKKIVAVLLDVIMPGMSSADTLKEIRRINKDACVILSSGASEDLAKATFPAEGIAGFIHKPYRRVELMATLMKLLTK